MHASREACIKYFYLSIICAGLLGLGIFRTYITSGTTSMAENAQILYELVKFLMEDSSNGCELKFKALLILALLFTIPFLFKMSAFPAQF
jgi:NADH:ubiquinone oxidoreductase subunit 2 (subunit N)